MIYVITFPHWTLLFFIYKNWRLLNLWLLKSHLPWTFHKSRYSKNKKSYFQFFFKNAIPLHCAVNTLFPYMVRAHFWVWINKSCVCSWPSGRSPRGHFCCDYITVLSSEVSMSTCYEAPHTEILGSIHPGRKQYCSGFLSHPYFHINAAYYKRQCDFCTSKKTLMKSFGDVIYVSLPIQLLTN